MWFLGRRINAIWCPRGPRGRGRALDPRCHPVRRLEPFFHRKKANIQIKIVSKIQPNQSYGSPVIKETVKGQNQERRNRETERQIQSRRGSRPSHAMETMDQRGDTSPSYLLFQTLLPLFWTLTCMIWIELTRTDAVFNRIAIVLFLCRNKSSRNDLKIHGDKFQKI